MIMCPFLGWNQMSGGRGGGRGQAGEPGLVQREARGAGARPANPAHLLRQRQVPGRYIIHRIYIFVYYIITSVQRKFDYRSLEWLHLDNT